MPGLEGTAPAKINLALHITGRRGDGYHLLESLVVFAAHGDRIRVEAAERDGFDLAGPFAGQIPPDEGNLIVRARDLLRRHFGASSAPPVRLRLEKNLPVAAGIGGGSSDAAATLKLLARHWRLQADPELLAQIALALGADVPMCLSPRACLARGIGEAVEPVPALAPLPLLLVNPGVPLSTPSVFAALLQRQNPPLPAPRGLESPARLADWLHTTRNDLEAPALSLAPGIGGVLERLRAEGALIARMSGSGATCFGIFEDAGTAGRAGAAIAGDHPDWFVRATTTTATAAAEPSHG